MSRLMLSSDLHLGHHNICKFREGFRDAQHHHEFIFENLARSINKRDHLILLGDVAFTPYWNDMIKSIKCAKKTLILGNHDTDRQVGFENLVETYDKIHSLWKTRGTWFSHCPIHPQELRGQQFNIHGHLHTSVIVGDPRYVNVCVDHTDFKPVSFQELMKGRY